jgi:hypothetical protein
LRNQSIARNSKNLTSMLDLARRIVTRMSESALRKFYSDEFNLENIPQNEVVAFLSDVDAMYRMPTDDAYETKVYKDAAEILGQKLLRITFTALRESICLCLDFYGSKDSTNETPDIQVNCSFLKTTFDMLYYFSSRVQLKLVTDVKDISRSHSTASWLFFVMRTCHEVRKFVYLTFLSYL